MISRGVKLLLVIVLLGLAAHLLWNATTRRRTVANVIAAAVTVAATYVLVRVKPYRAGDFPAPGSIVGDANAFLLQVPSLEAEFASWAAGRNLTVPAKPGAFLEFVWDQRDEIGGDWDRMIRPTIAAYGEALRRTDERARWTVRRRDVVVEVPRRPWLRSWVAHEVHDAVFADI